MKETKLIQQATEAIYELDTIADLKVVQEAIKGRWDEIERREAVAVSSRFRVGDRVLFDTRRGAVFGKIVSFGPKNVKVVADGGMRWKVAPSLLREVSP